MSQDLSNATLFEVSWEVCNKVGGIYAVVSSKILEALAAFGENYFLLGPDLGNNPDFEETDEPCWQELRQETDRRNLSCRFGRWNIPGRPKVILVGYRDRYDQSQLLFSLWNRYGVDSISGGWDYVEPVMFSTACGEVIEAACKALHIPADGPALAHFHEWMCGGGLLYLKTNAPYVGTVFTTHATMLGRSMAGSGFDIYKQMHQINPKHEAGAYNITAKCSMETASAREADCFTTVSRITADEAGVFLGRTPDVLTLNGYLTDDAAWKVLNASPIIGDDTVTSITIYYKYNGEWGEVDVPCTDFEKVVKLEGKLITEIYLDTSSDEPEVPGDEEPLPPTDSEITDPNGILADAVKLDCSTEGHNEALYDIAENTGDQKVSYTIGEVTGDADTGYTCTITVNAVDSYLTQYNGNHPSTSGHSYADGPQSGTIILKWNGSEWEVKTGETPVTFNVTCNNQGGTTDPTKPDDDQIECAIAALVSVLQEEEPEAVPVHSGEWRYLAPEA